MKKNTLSLLSLIKEQMKVRPHYIEDNVWIFIKDILDTEIKKLLTDTILNDSQLTNIIKGINRKLDAVAEITDDTQLYEADTYITETLDWYLAKSVALEYYREAANLNKIIDMMCIKLLK